MSYNQQECINQRPNDQTALTRGRTDHSSTNNSTIIANTPRSNMHPEPTKEHLSSYVDV